MKCDSSIDHDIEIKAFKNQMKQTVHFIFLILRVVNCLEDKKALLHDVAEEMSWNV